MLKKDTAESKLAPASNLRPFRCSECLHFKTKPLSDKQEVCSKLGIRGRAIAPSCFTPDISKIAQTSDQLVQLTNLMQSFSPSEKRILFALLNSKKKKVKFGTKIYFLAAGKDYLSNYVAGYVVGTTSRGEIMVMGDPDNRRRGKTYIAYFKSMEDLYTTKTFKIKRAELKKAGRIDDPNSPFKAKRRPISVDYEPPTIDQAPVGERRIKKRSSNRPQAVDKVLKRITVV